MTTRQTELLSFLRSYFKEHDRLPPTRVVAEFLGVWQNAAVFSLNSLVKAGELEKDGRYYRFPR